jgi:hypothetical protein
MRKVTVLLPWLLVGCAAAPTIQPASASRSAFDGATYRGQTSTITSASPGSVEYRVFRQGGTGFVSIQSVREDAEHSADEFCGRKGQSMNALRETVATPPFVLGNFPRIEIVFECLTKPPVASAAAPRDTKYARIAELKRLLDSGAITQVEFEQEKAKLFGNP